VLQGSGCRISEALAPTPERVDLAGQVLVFKTLKRRRAGAYRAMPVRCRLAFWTSSTSCAASRRLSGAGKGTPTSLVAVGAQHGLAACETVMEAAGTPRGCTARPRACGAATAFTSSARACRLTCSGSGWGTPARG
jgi:hypothetical protein